MINKDTKILPFLFKVKRYRKEWRSVYKRFVSRCNIPFLRVNTIYSRLRFNLLISLVISSSSWPCWYARSSSLRLLYLRFTFNFKRSQSELLILISAMVKICTKLKFIMTNFKLIRVNDINSIIWIKY